MPKETPQRRIDESRQSRASLYGAGITRPNVAGGDHGSLSGLGDDDHPQYLTTARGDARYAAGADLDALTLDDLADVDAPTPGDGEVLAWDDGDGAWKPSSAGAGDMLKAVYDADDDGVVDEAAAVEGVDVAGNSKYYGTNSGGTAGFYDLPAGGGATDLDDLSDVDTSTTPPTDGQVLAWDDGDSLWKPATVGGGGGGGYFSGATGAVASASTTAYATKGGYFTPDRDVLVTHVLAWIDPASTSEEFYAQIATVDNTTTCTILSILGTTSAFVPGSTDMYGLRLPFSSPVALDSTTLYLIVLVRSNPSPSGASALRIGTSSPAWEMNAPGEHAWGTPQFNTVGLSVSQAPTTQGSGKYNIALEGFIV